MDKRVAIISDLHCGHRSGLTPPNWRYQAGDSHWAKFTRMQEETWKLYTGEIRSLRRKGRPVDCLIVNGDCIDGRGERSGGTELITGDRTEQVKMAVACIEAWGEVPKIVMTRGTPYHTGDKESWEDEIADLLRAKGRSVKIGDHEWVSVNGFVFDCKHHVGGSQTPQTRTTGLDRDELWNAIWAEAGDQPRADMVVRSHCHYCDGKYTYKYGRRVEAIITPALQTMGTRFGARRCSGRVDWGLLAFDINSQGEIVWRREAVHRVASAKAKPVLV